MAVQPGRMTPPPETPHRTLLERLQLTPVSATFVVLIFLGLAYWASQIAQMPDGDDTTVEPLPAVTADSLRGGSVTSPQQLIDAAGDTLPCSDAVAVAPSNAEAQINCAAVKVIIRTYIDPIALSDADTASLLGKLGYDTLTGANWTISSLDSEYLRHAQERLGGTIQAASVP
jgi:hypothetical protein